MNEGIVFAMILALVSLAAYFSRRRPTLTEWLDRQEAARVTASTERELFVRILREDYEREILRWVARVDASELLVKTLTLELIEQKRLGFAREIAPPINTGPASVFPPAIVAAIQFSANGSQSEEARLYDEAKRLIGRRNIDDPEVIDDVAATIRQGLDESDLFG